MFDYHMYEKFTKVLSRRKKKSIRAKINRGMVSFVYITIKKQDFARDPEKKSGFIQKSMKLKNFSMNKMMIV